MNTQLLNFHDKLVTRCAIIKAERENISFQLTDKLLPHQKSNYNTCSPTHFVTKTIVFYAVQSQTFYTKAFVLTQLLPCIRTKEFSVLLTQIHTLNKAIVLVNPITCIYIKRQSHCSFLWLRLHNDILLKQCITHTNPEDFHCFPWLRIRDKRSSFGKETL